MDEHIKTCLHCGAPMLTQRNTKKYCSDQCKQAAYITRNQQPVTLNGKDDTGEFDDNETGEGGSSSGQLPFTVTDSVTKTVNGSDDTNQYGYNTETANTIREQQLPFTVTHSVTKTVNGNIARKPAQSYSIPVTTVNPQIATAAGYKEEKQPKVPTAIKQDDPMKNVIKVSGQGGGPLPKQKNNTVIEEPYEHVRSELLDEIADYLSDNFRTAYMFQHPLQYWLGLDLENVKWVSVRFRCLTENILRFDRQHVGRKTLLTINTAFKEIITSSQFKRLPTNYPLKKEIEEQHKKAETIANSMMAKTVRYILKRESKIKLIGMRFLLADLVPLEKFDNLNFSK